MSEAPIFNIGDLAKPATLLIEKVSNAIGRHFDPGQAIRMAEAEAKADQILRVAEAETDIKVAETRQRAAMRLLNEEMDKQRNIESIVTQAIPYLNEGARPDEIEDDWIKKFFQNCPTVSDPQMQQLWASILAGEANQPGSFSRSTVNLVSNLDRADAEKFGQLCAFVWEINGNLTPLIYRYGHACTELEKEQGITSEFLWHLEDLGLIRVDTAREPLFEDSRTSPVLVRYQSQSVTLQRDKHSPLSLGIVSLTRMGAQLVSVCSPEPVAGYFEYMCEQWTREGWTIR